jgi:hypothetical protein
MVQHLTGCDVFKTHHVVDYNVQLHWIKNSDDLFFECLLHRGVGAVGKNGFFPAAPIFAAVPLVFSGARPGAVGFTQSVGPASVAGSTMV